MALGRVVAVTASIALTGAVIGGVIGAILIAAWTIPLDIQWRSIASAAAWGGLYGASLGAVLAPITAWSFLRRVPLGRALLHTTIWTTVGAAVGLVLDRIGVTSVRTFPAGLIGALAGFLASAIRLRLITRTTAGKAGMESGPPHGSA
jgi:hypothetical protein